jgi:hypothetical protein
MTRMGTPDKYTPWYRFRPPPWWAKAQRQASRMRGAGMLLGAVALGTLHYAFGEWVTYPGLRFWTRAPFWAAWPWVLGLPLVHWAVWTVFSFGRLRPALAILVAAATLCFGDFLWFSVHHSLNLFGIKVSIEYWHWWSYWLPAVLPAGNASMARRCVEVLRIADCVRPRTRKLAPFTLGTAVITTAATFLATSAVAIILTCTILPRMPASPTAASLARDLLVRPGWAADFDFLTAQCGDRERLGTLLTHIGLARLQRKQFYREMDQSIYDDFVLSPRIDELPLQENNWRRPLWEHFYPLIRNDHDPSLAARVLVRALRQRVGIDSSYCSRVGVETIWTQGMTDTRGFQLIYVAVLRSVGIGARLDGSKRAELWDGQSWQPAPTPLIQTFISNDL